MLFATLLPLFAQEASRATIRVEVKAAAAAVAGAVVTVNGIAIQTDENGIAITSLPLGKVQVSVSKEGFLSAKASLQVDEAREWRIAFELNPQEQREEEVTVFATRTDIRLQDSPTRVEVLGPEEIEEKTMMTPGDIVMMLNEMGGLRVQSTSPSLGAASVRIQGMRGRYTAFLGDGLPLFGQQGGGLGLLQIPPVDLGQVEVIKGVSSALYGAGAMAGVVNLISRRPVQSRFMSFFSIVPRWAPPMRRSSPQRSLRHIGAHRFLVAATGKSAMTLTTTVSVIQPKMIGTANNRMARAMNGRAGASVAALWRLLMLTSPSRRSAHGRSPRTPGRAPHR